MPAPATLSNRQRRALADMGIDLWVRRTSPESEPMQVEEPVVARTTITVSLEAEVQPASVELECLAAAGAVVIGAFASAADRRFAQDVLLALAGAGAAVARTQFRWPQTQTSDRSPSAVRSAFTGFLRGQTQRTGARCVLVLGNAAAAPLDPALVFDGCTVLSFPDAAQLRGDAARKKALWLKIAPLVHR